MFTKEYFIEQAVHFRELIGQKSFWEDLERAARGMYGMIYCYGHSEGVTPEDEIIMRALSIEYDRRLAYIMVGRGNNERKL